MKKRIEKKKLEKKNNRSNDYYHKNKEEINARRKTKRDLRTEEEREKDLKATSDYYWLNRDDKLDKDNIRRLNENEEQRNKRLKGYADRFKENPETEQANARKRYWDNREKILEQKKIQNSTVEGKEKSAQNWKKFVDSESPEEKRVRLDRRSCKRKLNDLMKKLQTTVTSEEKQIL